ncbi:hypothetical protein T439DRAFT_197692 [Meredithblackwellia eburnea MCA 4105]
MLRSSQKGHFSLSPGQTAWTLTTKWTLGVSLTLFFFFVDLIRMICWLLYTSRHSWFVTESHRHFFLSWT